MVDRVEGFKNPPQARGLEIAPAVEKPLVPGLDVKGGPSPRLAQGMGRGELPAAGGTEFARMRVPHPPRPGISAKNPLEDAGYLRGLMGRGRDDVKRALEEVSPRRQVLGAGDLHGSGTAVMRALLGRNHPLNSAFITFINHELAAESVIFLRDTGRLLASGKSSDAAELLPRLTGVNLPSAMLNELSRALKSELDTGAEDLNMTSLIGPIENARQEIYTLLASDTLQRFKAMLPKNNQ